MPTLDVALAGVTEAGTALGVAAERAGTRWTTPREPGKWSPAQVVEHVARILEESAHVASGEPSAFPTMPFFLRPLIRVMMFQRILKRGEFLKMKAAEPFAPEVGQTTIAEGRARLQQALDRFRQACVSRAQSGQKVESSLFGAVPVADFARFQELHIRHHTLQMPGGRLATPRIHPPPTLPESRLLEKCLTPAGLPISVRKWLRAHLEHEAHHRGQLYLMLGLRGIEPPQLYGLSSEEVRSRSVG